MRHFALALAACASAAAHATPPAVAVTFVQPERFADVRNGYTQTPAARDFLLGEIRRHIERGAAARLAAGEALAVTITDVHLAGDYRAEFPAATNVRVVREVTPARIDLRFRVLRDGAVLREGARALRSTGYPTGYPATDPLNYEKALLDAWLAETLPATR